MAFRKGMGRVVERGADEMAPVPMGRLRYKVVDEAALLLAYESHLRLLEDRQKATVATYSSYVKGFCRWLVEAHPSVELADVTKLQVRAFLLQEANRGLKPCSRSTELFALRSFYRFLVSEDLSEENPAAAVTLPSPNRPRVEFYSDAEANAITEWVAAQPGLRWQVGRVMLVTLRFCGLRANELVTLRTSEVDLDARRISLVGKGRKARVIPIPHGLAAELRDYLDNVRSQLPASAYLFANPRGNRKLRGRYGPRALYGLVQEAGTSAGVTGRHFPHRWRHSYATSLIRRGVDLHVVQRLMGHSNIATTTRYLHLSDSDLIEAIDRAFPES
jgi:site-specific recombinase XerD